MIIVVNVLFFVFKHLITIKNVPLATAGTSHEIDQWSLPTFLLVREEVSLGYIHVREEKTINLCFMPNFI